MSTTTPHCPPQSAPVVPPQLVTSVAASSIATPGTVSPSPRSSGQTSPSTTKTTISNRLADYRELIRPRIAMMSLITVAIGYFMASGMDWQPVRLLALLCGTALVVASSSILNQWMEIKTDSLMPRTANRPLPSGRIDRTEALVVGILSGLVGTVCLAMVVNLLTAGLAAGTLLLYLGLYTPLKSRSSFCTTLGAIPGAMPPVLGWVAVTGVIDSTAWLLFGILFLWQFPHFLAIAWLYREQYAGAGLKMLPRFAGPLAVGFSIALAIVSIIPVLMPSLFSIDVGLFYGIFAASLSLMYFAASVRFQRQTERKTARKLLFASIIHLPVLLTVLMLDCWL